MERQWKATPATPVPRRPPPTGRGLVASPALRAVAGLQRLAGNRAVASVLTVPLQRGKVESGPLPALKGNEGGRFVEIHLDDDARVIDLDAIMQADPASVLFHEREYLLRKLLHAKSDPINRPQLRAIDDAVEHLAAGLVEPGWANPAEVLTLHVPNLTDYEREVFRARFSRAYQATTDAFEQERLSQARSHLQWLRWGAAEDDLGRQVVKGHDRLRDVADLGAIYDERFRARVAEVKARAPLTTAEIQGLADEVRRAERLVDRYAALTRDPPGQTTPRFQRMLKVSLAPVVARAARAGEEEEADRLLAAAQAEQDKDRSGHGLSAKSVPGQRSELFGALHTAGLAPHDVPAENRVVGLTTATCRTYTAATSSTAWISPRGVAAGQDVYSWPLTSDLNFAHGLVHADHKLVAAHLIPALLGGRPSDDNLVPAVNTVNGWLANNPERIAKGLVLSSGTCIQYAVSGAFARKPKRPEKGYADVVQALVPSGITVQITGLRYDGRGNPREWASYAPVAGTTTTHTVPDELMTLTPV